MVRPAWDAYEASYQGGRRYRDLGLKYLETPVETLRNHGITDEDTATYAATPPWHKLGLVIPKPFITTAEALQYVGDYSVELAPTYALIDGKYVEIPRTFATYRTDSKTPFTTVGSKYTPFQNASAIDFLDTLLLEHEAMWESIFTLHGGRIFVAALCRPEGIKVAGDSGETLVSHLFATNSHDGSTPIIVASAFQRPECANTLSLSLANAPATHRIRHTSSVAGKVSEARETLGLALTQTDAIQEVATRLVNTAFSESQFEAFINQLVPLPKRDEKQENGGRIYANAVNTREIVSETYYTTPNLDRIRGTEWGVLQAVADVTDHKLARRNTAASTADETRAKVTIGLGSGDNLTRRAFSILESAGFSGGDFNV